MFRNIVEINNPGPSNHFDQLVHKCVHLIYKNKKEKKKKKYKKPRKRNTTIYMREPFCSRSKDWRRCYKLHIKSSEISKKSPVKNAENKQRNTKKNTKKKWCDEPLCSTYVAVRNQKTVAMILLQVTHEIPSVSDQTLVVSISR